MDRLIEVLFDLDMKNNPEAYGLELVFLDDDYEDAIEAMFARVMREDNVTKAMYLQTYVDRVNRAYESK